jgi:hypothetical protein
MLESCWVPVAHAYNPSYSGGRDQEDHLISIWQPRQIVCKTLSWKTLYKNRAGGVAQCEGPELKPQYCQKKKKCGSLIQEAPHKQLYYLHFHPLLFFPHPVLDWLLTLPHFKFSLFLYRAPPLSLFSLMPPSTQSRGLSYLSPNLSQNSMGNLIMKCISVTW